MVRYFSVATALVFYYDAKHSDILWRSSHVDCYFPLPHFNNFLEEKVKSILRRGELDGKGMIYYRRVGLGCLEIRIIKFTSRRCCLTYSVFSKNATFSFIYDVSNLLKLWMVLTLIFISSVLLVFINRFDLFLVICIKVFQ